MNTGTVSLEAEHHTDRFGSKIGMWLFLYTEVLLFVGFFLSYAIYRLKYPTDFHYAASDLNRLMGTINTIVLLTSSLTLALSIAALERFNKKLSVVFLSSTIFLGFVFLVIKYFEWSNKIEHGIFPGSEILEARKDGEILFYGLYFSMTGMHAIHVIIGMIVLGIILACVIRNPYEKISFLPHQLRGAKGTKLCVVDEKGNTVWHGADIDGSVKTLDIQIQYEDEVTEKYNESVLIRLENGGLFWHLVDVIWIFLFPLFYLIT